MAQRQKVATKEVTRTTKKTQPQMKKAQPKIKKSQPQAKKSQVKKPQVKTVVPQTSPKKTIKKKPLKHPFFEKKPKNFRIGGDIQPKRDLTRYVKWPKYIRIQRQKRILLQRLKVPPALNQFNFTLDKNQSATLLRLLAKYKPETKYAKRKRLRQLATSFLEDKEEQRPAKKTTDGSRGNAGIEASASSRLDSKKPVMIKYGLNHVTDLIEIRKAKLVVIAHDVEPIELVCWLPALCRKKNIPYCIMKGKSRLGQLVHKKTAAVIAVDHIRREDQAEFDMLCRNFRAQFNDNLELRRKWGGGIMGIKSQHALQKKEKAMALEQAKKVGLLV